MPELDIRAELAPLFPLPERAQPDWADVVRRSSPRRRARRPVVLVAAAAAFLLAAAAVAVAASLGGFSSWLSGQPGAPVAPAEQQEFESANLRTFTRFAPGTELRRLLTTSASGTDFTLYGFRSGDDLCLKLTASGAVSGGATRCAPEHALQTTSQPAVVVSADEPFGAGGPVGADGYASDAYQATFGIASDGVSRVVVEGDDGTHDALLGGNAFLYVDDHPSHGARVSGVSAVSGAGDRVALDFMRSPYGMFELAVPPPGTFHGPARPQRTVTGGSVGWLARGEQPGEPVPAKLASAATGLATSPPPGFTSGGRWPQEPEQLVSERLLQPDPNDFVRMIVAGVSPSGAMSDPQAGICIGELAGMGVGSTCMQLSQAFAHGPLWLTIGGSGMSQYSVLAGLASDDVSRISAYLGNGQVVPVALAHNAFVARIARAQFPLRVVAYDASGLVIGVKDFASDGMTSPAPKRARDSVRETGHVTGPHGGAATLREGTPAGGYRCWSIDLDEGQSEGGCTPWPSHDGLKTIGVLRSHGDAFLAGEVGAGIASVAVTYPDGTTRRFDGSDGLLLAALSDERGVFRLHGYDTAGKEVASAGLDVSP
jgi:hypothetical protein